MPIITTNTSKVYNFISTLQFIINAVYMDFGTFTKHVRHSFDFRFCSLSVSKLQTEDLHMKRHMQYDDMCCVFQ